MDGRGQTLLLTAEIPAAAAASLTAVICLLQGASGSAATSELPQTKAREFDLQPAVHQAGAELQVPVEPQVASVDELHPLKHRQGRGGEDGGGRSRWRSWRSNSWFVTDVDDVVSEGQFEDSIQIHIRRLQDVLEEKLELTQCVCVCVFMLVCVCSCLCVDLQAALPAVLHHQAGVGRFCADTKELDQVLVFHLLHLFLEQDSAAQTNHFTPVQTSSGRTIQTSFP